MSVTAPDLDDLPGRRDVARSWLSRVAATLWRFARRSPLSAFWGVVAIAIIVVAIAAPLIAPYEPLRSDFRHMTKPPDALHYFGTDQIGRDTLTRVIYGSRASLAVAFGAVLLGTTAARFGDWPAASSAAGSTSSASASSSSCSRFRT